MSSSKMITPIKNPLEALHDHFMKYIRRKYQRNQKIIRKEDLEKAILGCVSNSAKVK